jgi:hypothetical protein
VAMHTNAWGSEISWAIGSVCSSGTTYGDHQSYEEPCCLPSGTYELTCSDSYGDGWNGGHIEIDGASYCDDFAQGNSKTVSIIVGEEAPTATPTATPTSTPTAAPTAAPTATPTATPTSTPTAAPTAAPTATPTVTPTQVPTQASSPECSDLAGPFSFKVNGKWAYCPDLEPFCSHSYYGPTISDMCPVTCNSGVCGVTCEDSDGGATDSYGDGCAVYQKNWCGGYDDEDFTSNTMCCLCK